MTVPPSKNQSQDSVTQPTNDQHASSSSTLDPIEHFDDCTDPAKQFVGRELPSWVKVQVPQWGERICVPEWDADEAIEDNGEGCVMDNHYRNKNGWKVRFISALIIISFEPINNTLLLTAQI